MADTTDKDKNTTPPAAAATPEQKAAPEVKIVEKEVCHVKPEMSKGEKLYNTLVYKAMNYWLNLGISLWVTDIFVGKKGKFFAGAGKEFFDRNVGHVANFVSKGGLISHKVGTRFAQIALGTFTLNSGGNILLIPTKLIEDRKRKIVHFLNDKVFHDPQIAPDGHKETPEEIYIEQEQPRQSWGRMVYRRLLGWGATTGAGIGIDLALRKELPQPIVKHGDIYTHKNGQDVFTDATVEGVSKIIDVIPGGSKITQNETVKRYMGYAALDSIYTMITSHILHKTNGAKPAKMPQEIGNGAPEATEDFTKQVTPYDDESKKKHADKLKRQSKQLLTPSLSHTERLAADPTITTQPSL